MTCARDRSRIELVWLQVMDTLKVAAEVGPESISAYVISMATRASDVLAVELLKREAWLVVSRHIPPSLTVYPIIATTHAFMSFCQRLHELFNSVHWLTASLSNYT